MTRLRFATISVLALAAAGCMTPTGETADAPGDEHPGAGAELTDARGRQVAVMEAGEQGGALYVVIDATGMAPGRYGVHLHAVGRCNGPGFESAGPHWNPTGRNHGLDADGAAVVIHADEDDFQTDPSGNSGPRIACGVIRRAG